MPNTNTDLALGLLLFVAFGPVVLVAVVASFEALFRFWGRQ